MPESSRDEMELDIRFIERGAGFSEATAFDCVTGKKTFASEKIIKGSQGELGQAGEAQPIPARASAVEDGDSGMILKVLTDTRQIDELSGNAVLNGVPVDVVAA